MAKSETKETYKDSKALGADVKTQYNAAIGESRGVASGLSSAIGEQKSGLQDYYKGMMKPTERLSPVSYNASHASGQGYDAQTYDAAQTEAARKIDASGLSGLDPSLAAFAKTGGIDPTRAADIGDTAAKLKVNGGLSDENIARIRGNGGYDEFAKTGGYTPEAIANIKAQAISPIGSYATGTRDELARRAAVQGGYTPGFDAAGRQLRRDTARNIADTSLNANVGIQEKVNEGRKWGIGGVAGAESTIGGLRQSGLATSGAMQTQLQDLTSRYMAQGLTLQQANAQAQADIDKANVANELNVNLSNTGAKNQAGLFNAGAKNDAASFSANAANQASMFNAGADNSAGMFNAGNANQANLFNITNAQDQYARGVGGLQTLQDQDVIQLAGERDRMQQMMGSSAQGQLGAMGIQSDLAKQPGVGGNIIAGIGAAANLAGNVMSGGMSGLAAGAIKGATGAVQSGYNAGWE